MGDACPFVFDPSNAATMHWLGLAALVTVAAVFGLAGALLNAQARIEDLEAQLARLQRAPRDAQIAELREALTDLLPRFDGWTPHDRDAANRARTALANSEGK